jgi:hypothetical protein
MTKENCEHKWVHLRHVGTTELGYRNWYDVDEFYCEKCLESKLLERPKPKMEVSRGF